MSTVFLLLMFMLMPHAYGDEVETSDDNEEPEINVVLDIEYCDLTLFRGDYFHFFDACGVQRFLVDEKEHSCPSSFVEGSCEELDGKIKPFVYDDDSLLLLNYERSDRYLRVAVVQFGNQSSEQIDYNEMDWMFVPTRTNGTQYVLEMMLDDEFEAYDYRSGNMCSAQAALFIPSYRLLIADQNSLNPSEYTFKIIVNPDGIEVLQMSSQWEKSCEAAEMVPKRQFDATWTGAEALQPMALSSANYQKAQQFNQLYYGLALKTYRDQDQYDVIINAVIPSRDNYERYIQPNPGQATPIFDNYECSLFTREGKDSKFTPVIIVLPGNETYEVIHYPTIEDDYEESKKNLAPILSQEEINKSCGYSMFKNDFLLIFLDCGVIRVDMASVADEKALEAQVKKAKKYYKRLCENIPNRQYVKPFYSRPDELLLLSFEDKVEARFLNVSANTPIAFIDYGFDPWTDLKLTQRQRDHMGKYVMPSGDVCDVERSVYDPFKQRLTIDNVINFHMHSMQPYYNNPRISENCEDYNDHRELSIDPTVYYQEPVPSEAPRLAPYSRITYKSNLHYDSTHQVSVFNISTYTYHQMIFYAARYEKHSADVRGYRIPYNYNGVCRIRTSRLNELGRFMLLPKNFEDRVLANRNA